MKRLLPVILLTLAAQICVGQTPAPFRQFFFNPYLFNPGYTGANGYTEVYLVYRKQWANFTDAPTTMGLNFQYASKKRVSLGASIVSDEVVGVRNTSFIGTFAYAVPIADAHSIRFGISGGVGPTHSNLKKVSMMKPIHVYKQRFRIVFMSMVTSVRCIPSKVYASALH